MVASSLPPPQLPTELMDHPFPCFRHLQTNSTPALPEIALIKNLVGQRRKILDGIDGEIAELDRRRRELVERKHIHAKNIETHREVISPARRLHSDALLAIFFILVSNSDSSAPRFSLHPGGRTIPVVSISHVCRRWREIAIGNPFLWSHINIVLPPLPNYPTTPQDSLIWYETRLSFWKRYMEVICTRVCSLVERSQGCPLHISFSASDNRDQGSIMAEGGGMHQEFLQTVARPLKRILKAGCNDWATLRMHLRMAETISPLVSALLAISQINLKGLHHLELDVAYQYSGAEQERIWCVVGQVLDLREAPITSMTVKMPLADMHTLRVRWDLLTSLSTGSSDSITAFGPQEATNVLRGTPNLVRCSIQLLDDGQLPFAGQQQALSLHRLERLSFRGSPARVEFAALLDTPSLISLSAINDLCPAQDEDRSAIAELVRRYGAQLTDVSLGYCALTPSALKFVLEHLVEATSLGLYGKVVSPVTVDAPWQASGQGAPAPSKPLEAPLDATLLQRLTPICDPYQEAGASVPECVCPKLQNLVCELGDESESPQRKEETKEAFLRLIEARRKVASVKQGRFGSLEKVDATFSVGPVDDMLGDLAGRGVDTLGISFKARYTPPYLRPCHVDVPIPGMGTVSISMNHHSHRH